MSYGSGFVNSRSTGNVVLAVALVIGLFALLWAVSAVADVEDGPDMASFNPVTLSSEREGVPLGPHLRVLEDPEGALTLEQVLTEKLGSLKPIESDVPNFGYTDSAYWVRVDLDHHSDTDERWLLELDYAPLQYIDLYVFPRQSNYLEGVPQSVEHMKGGSAVTVDERPFKHRTHVFPVQLDPGDAKTLLMRVESESSVNLPLQMWHSQEFATKVSTEFIVIGIYIGIMAGLIAYNLFIWAIVRESTYLLYSCFVSFMVLFFLVITGTGQRYLWQTIGESANTLIPFTGGATAFFAILFSIKFLDSKNNLPRYHYWLIAVAGSGLALCVAAFIFPYRSISAGIAVGAVFWSGSLLVAGLIALRENIPAARYYLLAWLMYLAGLVLRSMMAVGWAPANFISEYSAFIGSALEGILLSVALAARVRTLKDEKERAQDDALHHKQLALQTEQEYTRKLEQEVSARTEELSESLRRVEALNEETINAHARTGEYLGRVRTLLNNSGEGFLSFGRDQRVEDGYSTECLRIFNATSLSGTAPDLLAPDDPETHHLLRDTLGAVFSPDTPEFMIETYLSLLPREYVLNGLYCKAEYKYLSDQGKVMVILNDVTERKELESQLAEERQQLEFTVYALTHRDEFCEVIEDFKQFLSEDGSPLKEIHRRMHTFKSLFAQAGCPNLPTALHERESALADLSETNRQGSSEEIDELLDMAGLREAMEQELATLNEHLGREYFSREKSFDVPQSLIARLERDAIDSLGQASGLVSRVRALRYESLQKLLMPHLRTAHHLATRTNKAVKPIQCLGQDVRIDPVVYSDLFRSLLHVFRNAVDHGIESPEERVQIGKEEEATLTCSVSINGTELLLSIEDDGRGLDGQDLRSKAVAKGLIGTEDAQRMSDDQAQQLVFMEGMSSREEITLTSGRGIGLAAVKQAVSEIGGEVRILSRQGEGTRFIVKMPLSDSYMETEVAA